jgi:hypothetical protein
MSNYSPIYRKFIDDKNIITPNNMVRGKFYLIKEYQRVDGTKNRYTESTAPIIYTLFVSLGKDIVHAVKVTNVRPDLIKRFFGKFVNEDTDKLEIKGGAKKFYQSVVSKIPVVTNDAYRTYKLSGINKIVELDMDVNQLTPNTMNVDGIEESTQIKNK